MSARPSSHNRGGRVPGLLGTVLLAAWLPCRGRAQAEGVDMHGATEIQPRLMGMGGAFFFPERGEWIVEVQRWKRRPGDRDSHLRAVLFAPDRTVLHDVLLPGPGEGAPAEQRVRLSARVEHLGVYGLLVTSPEDRYGDYTVWGFRSNCDRYLIETSRGHRDRRHEEPIVLAGPERPGEVCFLPRAGEFRIDLRNLPPADEPMALLDGTGTALASLVRNPDGTAHHQVPAGVREPLPWRLLLPRGQAVVEIDGVTRWAADDLYRDMALWAPDPGAMFPLPENRWLLQPYRLRAFGRRGSEGSAVFTVHNNATRERTVDLALEFDGAAWEAALSAPYVTLPPREDVAVTLRYRVPDAGTAWNCRIRATPRGEAGFTTYSSFALFPGAAPAAATLEVPVVLAPYRHENEQFGYRPTYPVEQQMYFDGANRPYVAGERALRVRREGVWHDLPYSRVSGAAAGASVTLRSTKVAFDRRDHAYVVVTSHGAPALLRTRDGGLTADLTPIPGNGSFDIEQFSGHNVPEGPPPLIRVTRTAKDPNLIWRSLNDLDLFVPRERADGAIDMGEPIRLSRQCIGVSGHSGMPSSIVSRGNRVHVAWGEATEPGADVPGVPTYVATYDREERTLGAPVLIGYGPPANDVHNSPCITMDGKGTLHVLVGTHGRTFRYARSLQPNDSRGGWTEAENVGRDLSQTYVGLVCDRNDTLHLVFRLWRSDPTIHPFGSFATLAHMSKAPDSPWSEPRILVTAAFANYSIFYHRLTIDHRGRPFLSYDYWSTYWFYRNDRRERHRALLCSPDSGASWKLVDDEDLR
ncbi:MAG: BNR-4 repeat-containing protein [Lentisphaeria bacterium]|nr:BNR-4 repeat-containing protein [Lentisphaeria bacterium]